MVLRCSREQGIYPRRSQISYNLGKLSLKILRGQTNRCLSINGSIRTPCYKPGENNLRN